MYFEKSKFPQFSGARHDYPGFRREWKTCMSPSYNNVFQLREISKQVPKEVEPDVKNAVEMSEVWRILEQEYGQAPDICGKLLRS